GRRQHALQLEDVRHVVTFITNLADEQGMALPGRINGFPRAAVKMLPSSMTKKSIWEKYYSIEPPAGVHRVKYTSFITLWKQLVPYIAITRPKTDLCWTCQQNYAKISK
ncbi:hypothetical protein CAPTEDRAFT_185297, partial [Capitella teleta]